MKRYFNLKTFGRIIEYVKTEKKWLLPLLFGIVLIIAGLIIMVTILVGNKKSRDKYAELYDTNDTESVMTPFGTLPDDKAGGINAVILGSMENGSGNTAGNTAGNGNGNTAGNSIGNTAGNSIGNTAGNAVAGKAFKQLKEIAGVDLDQLMTEYPEIIGWIYFENEDISYPIMQSEDNEKYLDKAYDGTYARGGSIFLDYESTKDMSDPHSIIYGHNMADTTMFGRLHRYLQDSAYYDEHKYFRIYTGTSCLRYEIIAYGEVPDNSLVFWTFGPEPERMQDMLEEIKNASLIPMEYSYVTGDRLVTLSTCTAEGDMREIVCALCISDD